MDNEVSRNRSPETPPVQSGEEHAELIPIAEVTVNHSSGGPVTGESIKVTLDPRFNGQTRTAWTDTNSGIAQFYQLVDGRYDILTDATSNHDEGFEDNENFSNLNYQKSISVPCLHS